MSLDRLWAGWRATYIERVVAGNGPSDADRCLFCALAAGDPAEMLVLGCNEHAFAVMNAYPYTSGHLMVAPLRHVASLRALAPDEAAGFMELVRHATVAIEQAYHPGGMNVGANIGGAAGASVAEHLHFHVVPRWDGDTNFMTTVAEARVLPEPLLLSYQKLADAWPR
jgi:diadenosine tetraphosphate (Ap4A) HIT family hydrolase